MNLSKNLSAVFCAAMLSTTVLAGNKPPVPTGAVYADTLISTFQTVPAEKAGTPHSALLAAPHGAGTGGGYFDEVEPNDAGAIATHAKDVPFTARGAILPNDRDYYSVDVEAGQVFHVFVVAGILNSPLDPGLVILRQNGQSEEVLAQNDDYQGLDSFIEFTAPATGRISFVVLSAVTSQGGSNYTYRLWAFPVGGSRATEVEPNDNASEADQVGLPALYAPKIGSPGDVDWVQFQATAGDQLIVDINSAEFGFPVDPVVELYDSSGHKLFRNDDGGPNDLDSAFNVKLPSSGVYNLRLSDYRPEAGGNTSIMFVSISVQDGTASPTVTKAKRNPAGLLKKIVGSGFTQTLTAEVDAVLVDTVPVPNKPGVRKPIPAYPVVSGSVVTVVNADGRRSNPFVIP